MDMMSEGKVVALHEATRAAGAGSGRSVLTFRLGAGTYGIECGRVRELRSHEPPTPVPGSSPFVEGVVYLRGALVPIVDLRPVFGCARAEVDARTVVVLLDVRGRTVGAVVDAVSGMLDLAPGLIGPAPCSAPGAADGRGITGVARLGAGGAERAVLLVDVDVLMGSSGIDL
jgi:purine-binding chemotaxis protein CheW